MTTEELLKPRYEVIADYPEMERHNVNKGDILTDSNSHEAVRNQNGDPVCAFYWDQFPEIFKPLQWFEKRDFSLAGMYIRAGEKDSRHTCYKLIKKEDHPHMELWTMESGGSEHCYPISNTVPIEQSEYDQYIKSTLQTPKQ